MKRQTKWCLKCDGSVPEHLGDLLSNADETELHLLIGLLLSADREGNAELTEELLERLGMERTVAEGAVRYWKGAGLLANATKAGSSKKSTDSAKIPSAHRNGAVEQTEATSSYETAELASLLEERAVTSQFIEEAQRVAGKTFNTYDTGILVGLVHRFGFEEAAVLAILAYVRRLGKRGVRYVEKVALGFYDEGLTAYEEVQARIDRIERSGELLGKIKHLFGFGTRELSATERKLFLSWVEQYGYDLDVIRMAYEITVDKIQQPAPKYTNGVLEKWYAQKLRTVEEIRAFEEAKRGEKDGGRSGVPSREKSYDLDDFFEAALKRSYDNGSAD
ncbi:MAG: DnaD domain protein [Clostridia bacterium]|nr:DnaD domain protein [Clostridia bacterium]